MNTILKTGVFLGTLIIALSPLWIWLAVYNFLGPTGFWEKFILLGLGVWFGGFIQLMCLVGWIVILFGIYEYFHSL